MLEIKDNSYYKSIMEAVPAEKEQVKQEKLPDFINQFYSTSANIINQNYIVQSVDVGDEIPF